VVFHPVQALMLVDAGLVLCLGGKGAQKERGYNQGFGVCQVCTFHTVRDW
jgi:hypothetical protein